MLFAIPSLHNNVHYCL